MDKQKVSMRRESLGYTREDLQFLLDSLGLPQDRASDIPPFPPKEDFVSRRRIYETLRLRGKYAPISAWCWDIVRVSGGEPGKRSSEIYAEDHAAHNRQRASRNTQIKLYEAIRANEAFIAGKLTEIEADEAEACFLTQLEQIGIDIIGGEWGEIPPPEVLSLFPSYPVPGSVKE